MAPKSRKCLGMIVCLQELWLGLCISRPCLCHLSLPQTHVRLFVAIPKAVDSICCKNTRRQIPRWDGAGVALFFALIRKELLGVAQESLSSMKGRETELNRSYTAWLNILAQYSPFWVFCFHICSLSFFPELSRCFRRSQR